MAESVFKLIEIIGTSTESWEKAASNAVETASMTLQDIRIAEVIELDMVIEKDRCKPIERRSRCHSIIRVKNK